MPNSHLEIDWALIQELELLSSGDLVHTRLNLVGAYESAVEQYNDTGDEDFREVAEQAQTAMRVMLFRLRQQRAASRPVEE